MKKLFSFMLALSLVVALEACGSSSSGDAVDGDEYTPDPSNIIIASGPIGGGWYSSAAAISEILMREIPNLNVTVTEGGGETNIKDVADGSAQIGFTFSNTFNDAINGKEQFKDGAIDNVNGVATLYQSYFQSIVLEKNEKYNSFDDLKKGAHILPGRKTFSGQSFTKYLLENHYDTSYEDIESNNGKISYTGYSEMSNLLNDGHADAAMAMTAAPSSFIMEINSLNEIQLLEIETNIAKKIEEANPGFVPTQIPENTYKNQNEPVDTIGAYTVMVTNSDISDELVERIVTAILENKDELSEGNEFLKFIEEDTFKSGFNKMPVHKGVDNALD